MGFWYFKGLVFTDKDKRIGLGIIVLFTDKKEKIGL